ncbi:MAG: response regulator transcription factor [Oscillospiraceae bacterium]|nr:response regulator transcription factor [Oscillospiraceae bacterium]
METCILLAEDDPQIREIITDYFSEKSEGKIRIACAENGTDALDLLRTAAFDLIILDIMMPGIDGFSLCREIRSKSDVPVMFLTARAREEDLLYGYELGCDDYVIKPFSLAAVYAKCTALLKRANGTVLIPELVCGAIRMNLRTLTVTANGGPIALAPKEFALLKYLLEHKNWVVSRNMLLDRIWGNDYFGSSRVVDNHIKKLRHKLGRAGSQIHTVITQGYKLTE